MKVKCEQWWLGEVCEKKTLDLYAAVKGGLKKEMYVCGRPWRQKRGNTQVQI